MRHLVFVYGTLKRGHGNHRLLESSEFFGDATTEKPHALYVSGLPYLMESPNEGDQGRHVIGEIYEVNPIVLRDLDMLEGHPTLYERKLIEVRGIDDEIKRTAWGYYYQGNIPKGLNCVSEYKPLVYHSAHVGR